MDLSSDRSDLENLGSRPARAGLRVRPADVEPTGLFVAVEMTVLVLVAALAMASVIVSGNEMAERAAAGPTAAHRADRPSAGADRSARVAGETLRLADRRHASDGVASR